MDNAAARRIAGTLNQQDRVSMKEWLTATGLPESEIDIADTQKLLEQWVNHYDPGKNIPGMTNAKRNY